MFSSKLTMEFVKEFKNYHTLTVVLRHRQTEISRQLTNSIQNILKRVNLSKLQI